jgi:hypothetical protein
MLAGIQADSGARMWALVFLGGGPQDVFQQLIVDPALVLGLLLTFQAPSRADTVHITPSLYWMAGACLLVLRHLWAVSGAKVWAGAVGLLV